MYYVPEKNTTKKTNLYFISKKIYPLKNEKKYHKSSTNVILFATMGNFYIVEAGGNGFAARKQKKNSS